MSKLEKSVDEQIIELVNQYKQISIKQIAERLGKDLGQISKRITVLEKRNILKKMSYNPTGSKTHTKMVMLVGGQVQQEPFIKTEKSEENLESQFDSDNLIPTNNLIGQFDSDKLNTLPDDDLLDLDLDLSDNDILNEKTPKISFEKDIPIDSLTDEERMWLNRRIYDKSFQNGKFRWDIANSIVKKLNL